MVHQEGGIHQKDEWESDEFQNRSTNSGTTFFKNRMKLCSFAVCLLWASSLRTSSFLATQALNIPSLESVYSICKSTLHIILEEEDSFSQCADRQLRQCELNLNNAINSESKRVNNLSTLNSKIISDLNIISKNCSRDGSLLHKALMGWHAKSQPIPIINHVLCSARDREKMMSTVYDIDVLKSEALAISMSYNKDGTNTLTHLANYVKERAEYDRNYAQQYINGFELEVQNYIRMTPMPSLAIFHKFSDISLDIETLFDCSTLLDISYFTCGEFFPEINFNGHIKFHADAILHKWLSLGDYWRESHKTMIDQAILFFNKAKHAEDMFLYYWNNATYFWNHEVSDFTKDITSMILNCNQCVGRTLGNAYDSIKKIGDISFIKLSPSFPIDIRFNQEFKEQLEEIFDTMSLDMNLRVIENFETFKHQWTLPLQKSKHILEEMDKTLNNVKNSLGQNLSILPDDYNPPRYNGTASNVNHVEQEIEHYNKTSMIFMEQTEETINLRTNAINTSESIQPSNESIGFKTNLTEIASKLRNFDVSFEKLISPKINFDIWFLRFTSLSDLLYLFDYSMRAFFTLRLVYKYWRVSEVKVPTIDVRHRKPVLNPFQMTNGRLVILFFTNPMVGASILLFLALATAGTIVSIYIPLYKEYKNGCLNSVSAHGTFIGYNIYSSSYNFALRAGSSSIVKDTDAIDVQRSNVCKKMHKDSVTKLNDQIEDYNIQTQIIENVARHVGVIEQCVDSEVLDAQFKIACCNYSGYDRCSNNTVNIYNYSCPLNYEDVPANPYLPPGSYISQNLCDLKVKFDKKWHLEKAIFNCSSLPECDITCSGPNKQKIRQITKECSCAIEWFLHSYWLHGILSLLIYILMNISRSLLVNGIARVFWRKLHPCVFTVVATCDQEGMIVTRNTNQIQDLFRKNKNKHRNADNWRKNYIVKKEIDRNSILLQMTGLGYILGAILLNLLWIIIIFKAPDATNVSWLVS